MDPASRHTPNKDSQAESEQASPRPVGSRRKTSSALRWLIGCAVLGVLGTLALLGWFLFPRAPDAVTILPIENQEVAQGETLQLPIAVRRTGRAGDALKYSVSGAPPAAKVDAATGEFCWPTTETDKPGTYRLVVKVRAAGSRPVSDQKTFVVRLLKKAPEPVASTTKAESTPALTDMGAYLTRYKLTNPFEVETELTPHGRIDELVLDKLRQLKIEPANPCSDAVFLRRVYLDTIGTLPTAEEAKSFLDDKGPDKRSVLIDRLLERPEFADYWAMKWSDLLRVKAEFPINLWPNGAQAYHRWIRTAIKQNMPYDRFVRELLTSCGSNFRTPQVNFFRALQSKEPTALAQAVALAFMGVRAESWPKERWAGMAVFFSQVGYKPTREWKEEIVVFDPRKATGSADAPPPVAVLPDGTKPKVAPGRDPREVFAAWLISAENPWFARHIVNRVWYWLLGRGIVHEPDDIRSDNPAQNRELLNWLAAELVRAKYDLKHIYRLVLNSTAYQLSCIPKSKGPEAAANFACYSVRRLDAEVLMDALCQVTGTSEQYSSMIPEPFTFIPEKQRSIALPDGSITSSVLEMFGRPSRDTGLESERNNRMTAAQTLHLLNSSHVRSKIQKGPKIQELVTGTDAQQMAESLYLTIFSRRPTESEQSDAEGRCKSKWGAETLVWALVNTEEFLFRH